MVHKRKHDMVLNLGLGSRGNTFSDQTPTPTRFIRNCEEVGLFQDLQNVNPFEETFRRAVEAVKTGQTPLLEKSFQTDPSDDTLHTPNVFPLMTDLPCGNHSKDLGLQENEQLQDNWPKKDHMKNTNEKEMHAKSNIEPNKIILGNISHKKRKISVTDKPVVVEAQNENHNEAVTAKDETYLKNISPDGGINELNQMQIALKEKIKNSIHNKQVPIVLQLKVPIPKSNSVNRCQKSQKDRFSTFSKNSLKFDYKLEKPQSGIFDLSKKRRVRKNYSGLPKERIEILERNRAAATRCREKKKIYVSYLEKLNRELTDTNKKLEHHNIYLRKQISILQAELLKHQDCNMSSLKRENIATTFIDANVSSERVTEEITENIQSSVTSQENDQDHSSRNNVKLESEATVYDTAEVSLSDKSHCTNDNESIPVPYSKPYSIKIIDKEDKLRKVYTDHSYFNYINLSDIRKRFSNSNAVKSKLTSAFVTNDITNQNIVNENTKESFNIVMSPEDLEVESGDITI